MLYEYCSNMKNLNCSFGAFNVRFCCLFYQFFLLERIYVTGNL